MMLPRKKRQRPNPANSTSSSIVSNPAGQNSEVAPGSAASTTSQPPSRSTPGDNDWMPPNEDSNKQGDTNSPVQGLTKQVRKAQSWYGSWPRPPKAAASTSVARENILGGSIRSNKSSDLSRFDSKRDSDSASLRSTATKTGPDLSEIPEDAMNGNNDGPAGKAAVDKSTDKDPETNTKDNETSKPDVPVADENKSPGQEAEQPQQQQQQQPQAQSALPEQPTETTPQRPTTSSGWLGWLAKAPFTETQAGPVPEPMAEVARPKEDADHKPNTLPTSGVDEARPNNDQKPSTPPPQPSDPDTTMGEAPSNTPATTLWYDFWSKSGTKPQPEPDATKVIEGDAAKSSNDVVMEDAPPTVATPESSTKPQPSPKAGSTWAFWSRDTPKDQGTPARKESGELAVIGEGSENHPAPMAEDDVSTPSKPPKPTKDSAASTKSTWRRANKRLRPESMDIDNQSQSPTPSGVSTPQESTISVATTKVDSSSKSIAESVSAKSNLLLPSFTSTYQMKDNPSIVKQITQFLLRTQQAPANHVFRVSEHPKIRKAIAIGVHGLFPSAYLRPMIGQPTGTSLRFASLCADAIRKWADEHGCSDCEIEKVALEGEGKINERVSNLWKLMLNWIEHIRGADLIIIACHSQGVPVSVMLLEKLIDLGIITNAKIGVCAMAGVSLGPFPEYKSSLFGAPATELWDFGNPQSQNAQRFEAALKRVLDYGARITFIGSIDDQLVPLESALYSPAHHPYIYRAVFIDGRVHAPDFIAHLVGFALKLRNLGITDHGLIRELSLPLAGSLYSGEGHSRLYFESAVYDLAVSHALETTSAPRDTPPCDIRRKDGAAEGGSAGASGGIASGSGGGTNNQTNPYVLPWIMRGLLEEDLVKTELSSETEELLRQFDDWKPTTKALKDVKYRLEAVRSKL